MSDDLDELQKRIQEKEEADLARARQVPSQFVNRAFIRTLNGLTRITFGEQVLGGEPTVWTVGITLTTDDALAVADLIQQQAQYEANRQAYFANIDEWDQQQSEDQDKAGDA